MRKVFFTLGIGFCVVLAMTSCKSSESAYKKAYEKAKQAEATQTVAAPAAQQAATQAVTVAQQAAPATTVIPSDVRQEKVSVVSGANIKEFSVVCGSFGVKTNADNLKSYLDGEGYSSTVVLNPSNNMYRVIVGTYSTHDEASRARDAFKAKYPSRTDFQGSWLLYKLD